MKKVLIIANLFHASPRIPGLAKYLPEFGWQPIILTAPLGGDPESRFGPSDDFVKSGIRIIETPYSKVSAFWKGLFGFDKINVEMRVRERLSTKYKKFFSTFIFNAYQSIFGYPDADKNWRFIASKKISELLQKKDIDAVISSSSPVTSHLIAKDLKTRHKIPWIADLRDLWSQNHYYPYGPVRKLIDKRLELKTLSTADALVTASQPCAEKLRTLHKGKLTYLITNGFDPEKLNDPPAKLTPKFTITYTGTIYTGKQDPSKLFAALRDLVSNKVMDPKDVEVRFYGYKNGWLRKEIKKYGLSDIVKQCGVAPRQVAFEKQRESQLLLLLNWEDQRERGVYTLKVFEYLAAQRPILATGGTGDDVIKELLDETAAGVYGSKVGDIRNILSDLYSGYKLEGKIGYNGNRAKINNYSYREMAKKFVEVLDDIA
jgi:glycosyltransferase involved in cell wall biosynthesis